MRYAIRVTSSSGDVMYVREGPKPGEGPIVKFPSEAAARRVLAGFEPGLEEGDVAHIVPAPREES